MKLRLTYHDFAEHLKNSFKIQGRFENISFSQTAVVSDQNTNTNIRWHTNLICILITTNSILMLNISHSEFHSGVLWYHLMFRHNHFLPDTSNVLQTTKTPCADEYNMYKMNPVIYLMCEEPATVNV